MEFRSDVLQWIGFICVPLATSPMIEEILPLPPNTSRATAKNSSQCHTLRLPMSFVLLFAAEVARFAASLHNYRRKGQQGQVCNTFLQPANALNSTAFQ
jgi:hypothetical protein